jgi:hypothetical protein
MREKITPSTPSKRESESKRIEENPLKYLKDNMLEVLRHQKDQTNISELEKLGEAGSDVRMDTIDYLVLVQRNIIRNFKNNLSITLDKSFESTDRQIELAGIVINEYIRKRRQEAKSKEDRELEKSAKKHRGQIEEVPPTIHIDDI